MKKKHQKLLLLALVVLGIMTAAAAWFMRDANIAVLNPGGAIAEEQLRLIIITSLLSLIVILPVFALTFHIVWKYRVDENGKPRKKHAKYNPEWDGNRLIESVWWGIPIVLITILGVIIWNSSHKLDPYRPIASSKEPLTVEVVSLEWKWLFIYPEQNIATVNYLQIPEDTPINFKLTSDAPMNSFWIPQLGGQVYTMSGMSTKLHLIADEPGTYRGVSANISGEGFSGMKFDAKATSDADFDKWVRSVQKSSGKLTMAIYDELAKPSRNEPVKTYGSVEEGLYDTVVMKYMEPGMKNKEDHDGTDDSHGAGH